MFSFNFICMYCLLKTAGFILFSYPETNFILFYFISFISKHQYYYWKVIYFLWKYWLQGIYVKHLTIQDFSSFWEILQLKNICIYDFSCQRYLYLWFYPLLYIHFHFLSFFFFCIFNSYWLEFFFWMHRSDIVQICCPNAGA